MTFDGRWIALLQATARLTHIDRKLSMWCPKRLGTEKAMKTVCKAAHAVVGSLCLLFGESFAVEAVTIAKSNRAPVIVAQAEPPDQVAYAVEDLRHYLGRILGREIVVCKDEAPDGAFRLSVGDVPENRELRAVIAERDLGEQGFVLEVSSQAVQVLGGSKFGTAYGVYELLERLGVRWVFPGEWGEVVPEAKTLALAAGRFTDKPVFATRVFASWAMGAPSTVGHWCRRQRNFYDGYGGHSGLLSPKKYGKDHPTWYAEIGGKRRTDSHGSFKLCHSNEEMVGQAVHDVLDNIRKRRESSRSTGRYGFRWALADSRVLSVSPTDGAGFCRCEECQKLGSVSDRVQRFANQLAEAVVKEFPDQYVGYYGAYSEHQDPPTIQGHEHVIVYLTTWQKDLFKALEEPRNRAFLRKIEGFARTCPKIAIRDYDGMFSCWWGWGPISLIDVHRVDYPIYHRLNVRGFITEAQDHWAAAGQSYYVTHKLWWNPYADVEAIKRDFVEKGFGRAAEPMWRYWERINKERGFLKSTTLLALRNDLEEAVGLAEREDVRQRLDCLRLYYVMLEAVRYGPAGKLDQSELVQAARIGQSLVGRNVIGKRMCDVVNALAFQSKPGEEVQLPPPHSQRELDTILARLTLPEPKAELSEWIPGDDYRMVPLDRKPAEFDPRVRVNFRYGANTLMIYACADEKIHVAVPSPKRWPSIKVEYELCGPQQTVVAAGVMTPEQALAHPAGSEGIYTLTINTGGRWTQLDIANRWAVIKASSVQQHLHPISGCVLYFYVPHGTKEFAFVGKASQNEPYQLTVWGPHDDQHPVLLPTRCTSTSYEEHRIDVPPAADGKVWKLRVHGEDKDFFLLGIPPFLTIDPARLLAPGR